jgi:hypothetical protein
MKARWLLSLLALLLLLQGCKSQHTLTVKNATPQQHTLRITTQDGGTIDLALGDELDPKTLIALQTALSNVLILKAELIQNQAVHQQRLDNLTALQYGLNTLCFLATLTALTVVIVTWRKRGGDHT